MDAIKRSKNEWWKTEQDRKGKHLERKPASLRDTVIPGVRNKITDVESAKVCAHHRLRTRHTTRTRHARTHAHTWQRSHVGICFIVRAACIDQARARRLPDQAGRQRQDLEETVVCRLRGSPVLLQNTQRTILACHCACVRCLPCVVRCAVRGCVSLALPSLAAGRYGCRVRRAGGFCGGAVGRRRLLPGDRHARTASLLPRQRPRRHGGTTTPYLVVPPPPPRRCSHLFPPSVGLDFRHQALRVEEGRIRTGTATRSLLLSRLRWPTPPPRTTAHTQQDKGQSVAVQGSTRKAGWLLKMGAKVNSTWCRRWIVIHDSLLSYYQTPQVRHPPTTQSRDAQSSHAVSTDTGRRPQWCHSAGEQFPAVRGGEAGQL